MRRQHHRKAGGPFAVLGSSCGTAASNRRTFVLLPCCCLAAFVAGCFMTLFVLPAHHQQTTTFRSTTSVGIDNCAISLGRYQGPQYVHPQQTVPGRGRCLVESKFLKVQQHSVQFPATEQDKLLPPRIDDWIWIDYHDRINVLIEVPAPIRTDTTTKNQHNNNNNNEPHFQILQQTKYALEGRDSLAIVGGIVEPGEIPAVAARREVVEETAFDCTRWQSLGRYRTDVNRGMGWTHAYVAQDCRHSTTSSWVRTNQSTAAASDEEVGVADTERQDLRIMSLSEVRQAVQNGEFLEIQWTATVALAMLYYEHRKEGG